jgi:hypothetical protein
MVHEITYDITQEENKQYIRKLKVKMTTLLQFLQQAFFFQTDVTKHNLHLKTSQQQTNKNLVISLLSCH